MKNKEEQATTEFLRIAEGMVRYVDKECEVEGSGKAVFCVAVDCNGDGPKTMLAASGNQSLLASGIVASIVAHKETRWLFDKVYETLGRLDGFREMYSKIKDTLKDGEWLGDPPCTTDDEEWDDETKDRSEE